MKATELMIGDWLRYSPKSISLNNNYGGPYRVEGVSQDTISLGAKNYRFVVSDKEIDPIPLTPEILEKNGFGFVKSYDIRSVWNGQWIYKGLELATCCLNRDDNWPCFINIDDSNIKCEYVHQLQHALRLCKLDELADNFKI